MHNSGASVAGLGDDGMFAGAVEQIQRTWQAKSMRYHKKKQQM